MLSKKIAIVGSRKFKKLSLVKDFVDSLSVDTTIVSGGALGVDQIAEASALAREMPTKIFLPDWKGLGLKAGTVRNAKIVEEADEVVAFWDGESKGTLITIEMARKSGKPLKIIL
jgi:hypothetical protein